jgi:hypothetical protein
VVVEVVLVEQGQIGVILVIHAVILVEWTHVILETHAVLVQLILVTCAQIHVMPEAG